MLSGALRFFYRVVGEPPVREASKAERLGWVQRINVRWSLPMLVVLLVVVVATGASSWLLIFVSACIVFVCGDLVFVGWRIRRERDPLD